jgi:hypothetical protein
VRRKPIWPLTYLPRLAEPCKGHCHSIPWSDGHSPFDGVARTSERKLRQRRRDQEAKARMARPVTPAGVSGACPAATSTMPIEAQAIRGRARGSQRLQMSAEPPPKASRKQAGGTQPAEGALGWRNRRPLTRRRRCWPWHPRKRDSRPAGAGATESVRGRPATPTRGRKRRGWGALSGVALDQGPIRSGQSLVRRETERHGRVMPKLSPRRQTRLHSITSSVAASAEAGLVEAKPPGESCTVG